jgi:N-acetylneuraminic acid mutarotase
LYLDVIRIVLKTSIIFLISIFISPIKFDAQTWAQLADFPAPERDDGFAFVINNKAYCGAGLKVGWLLGNDFHCLDLGSETWTTLASMPAGQERQYACGFTDGTNGYVFGGEAWGNDLNTLWMYSPATNSWTAKASKPGNGVRGACCFVIANTAYIVGGAVGTTDAINEVWAYDMLNNSWTQKNNLPISNWRGCAGVSNGKGYLLFGMTANYAYNRYLYKYDPQGDTWSYQHTFPGSSSGLVYSSMQTINNELIVFSGKDSLNVFTNDLWTYDVINNTWNFVNALPATLRKGGMGFADKGTYYYTCGITPGDVRLKETWKIGLSVGITEYPESGKVLIYPNPASTFIHIQGFEEEDFKILTIRGQLVSEGKIINGNIDISLLEPGIYFLGVNGTRGKIIKQ